jgi:hypothetical protein
MFKTCTLCRESKALEEFPIRKTGKYGRNARCTPCNKIKNNQYSRDYRKNNPEKRAATQAAYNQSEEKVYANRKWRFGLTPEAVTAMVEAQGGVCGLCRRDFLHGQTFVDHDHSCCPSNWKKTCGRCIRAVLCRTCNQGLGFFQDNPEMLREAADYIERYR